MNFPVPPMPPMTPKIRQISYAILGWLAGIAFLASVMFMNLTGEVPMWLVAVNQTILAAWTWFGFTASKNVQIDKNDVA